MKIILSPLSYSFILVIFVLISTPAYSQTVRANNHEISVEWTNNDDFADLRPLLSSIRSEQIVHLKGDGSGDAEAVLHKARKRLLRFFHEQGGYNVLVLPVGIFEGSWTNDQLQSGNPAATAANTMYRVWRESEDFLDILRYIQQTKTNSTPGIEIIGGLCRYHATGKELYAPHLIQFFSTHGKDLLPIDLKDKIQKYLAGRSRLSRGPVETRDNALQVTKDLLDYFPKVRKDLEAVYGAKRTELEFQFLRNMLTFVDLERLRAQDIPDDKNFGTFEKKQNLDWFLNTRYPNEKLIYWEGRGANQDALPAGTAKVFVINLTYENP